MLLLSQFVFNPILFKKIMGSLYSSPSLFSSISLISVSLFFLPSLPFLIHKTYPSIIYNLSHKYPSFTSIACNWVASNLQTYMTNWSYITINSCLIFFLQYTTHLDLIAIFSLSDFFFFQIMAWSQQRVFFPRAFVAFRLIFLKKYNSFH